MGFRSTGSGKISFVWCLDNGDIEMTMGMENVQYLFAFMALYMDGMDGMN
jgi:hypothetical protein